METAATKRKRGTAPAITGRSRDSTRLALRCQERPDDGEAWSSLLTSMRGVCVRVAKDFAYRLRVRGPYVDDLIQAGLRGVAHAAPRFDPSRGFQFATYAWDTIWREVDREASRLPCGPLAVSHNTQASIRSRNGRYGQWTPKPGDLRKAAVAMDRASHAEAAFEGRPCPHPGPAEEVEEAERLDLIRAWVRAALGQLGESARSRIVAYYGLDDREPRDSGKIALSEGVSGWAVTAALQRARARINKIAASSPLPE